jgi:hypothetical protein
MVIVARISWMFLAILMMFFVPSSAAAQSYTYPDSCYVCESTSLIASECVNPRDGENGQTSCTIGRVWVAVICGTSGPACMYSCFGSGCDAGGGGGGGGTGSGGSTCTISNGACPADCFSCGGNYY